MGQEDTTTKIFISNNRVFADVFNFFLYNGERVIHPENLRAVDTTETGNPYGSDGKTEKAVQKYRDILKYASIKKDENAIYCLLGIENQTSIHYAMPVKNAVYDVLQYARQVEKTAKKHRSEKDYGTKAEYLSGFHKDDRLIPVITLTVLFSPKKWDGPRSIHEMFGDYPKEILRYIPNYSINLIEPYDLNKEELSQFQTDFGAVMEFIKCSQDKKMMKTLVSNDERFKHLDRDAADVITSCTKFKVEMVENQEGEVNMCKAIEDWIAEERKDERIAANKETALRMRRENFSQETIAEILNIPLTEVRQILKEK